MATRDIIKKLSFNSLKIFPFKTLLRLSSEKVIFPFYHLISDSQPLHTKHLYKSISSLQFKKDLDFMLKYYTPASIENVIDYVAKGKKSSKPLFSLSFDDGLSECFEFVMPILKEKGIPATFFINSAFVDNKLLFHKHKCSLLIEALYKKNNKNRIPEVQIILSASNSNLNLLSKQIKNLNYFDEEIINQIANLMEIDFNLYLTNIKPYMTTTQIQQAIEMGFSVGSHGIDHPEFYLLDNARMRYQVEESFRFLNEKFKLTNHYFAFPFTDYNVPRSFFNYLTNHENIAFSFGTAGLKRDMETKHIQRIPMEVNKYNEGADIIRSEYSYYFFKSFFRKNYLTRD